LCLSSSYLATLYIVAASRFAPLRRLPSSSQSKYTEPVSTSLVVDGGVVHGCFTLTKWRERNAQKKARTEYHSASHIMYTLPVANLIANLISSSLFQKLLRRPVHKYASVNAPSACHLGHYAWQSARSSFSHAFKHFYSSTPGCQTTCVFFKVFLKTLSWSTLTPNHICPIRI
jgi:hypothetical protein